MSEATAVLSPTVSVSKTHADLRAAIKLALIFGAIKFVLHFAANLLEPRLGYGIFRDEYYYLMCGRRLAWGYLDQPPMVAAQARLAELLFGHSQAGLRIFSTFAGALKISLAGILAWAMGGNRKAQFLAMSAAMGAGVYLGIDGYLSMNSFEPVFWMGCILALLMLERTRNPYWYLIFGACGGLGLENKYGIGFFLVALLAGVLLSPQRRLLWSKWTVAAVGLLLLIALPNFLWEAHLHWPTIEWLNDVKNSGKDVVLGPVKFFLAQILMLQPASCLVWISGLVWLLTASAARRFRFIGWAYLLLFAVMVGLHAKDYYLAPYYPALMAAGAVAWAQWLRRRQWILPSFGVLLLAGAAVFLPYSLPILAPQTFLRYEAALHFRPGNTETGSSGPLPQFYADRFGWQEQETAVAKAYNSLSPEDRAKVGILCFNYGSASAMNVLGAKDDLPVAISGHQNYWFWGPHGYTGEVMILVGGDEADIRESYASVTKVGRVEEPFAVPYEHKTIWLCRNRKQPYSADWNDMKNWM